MDLIPASQVPDELLLGAINASFARPPRSLDWFRWKHRESRWGPSTGFAAVAGDGEVLGVRLFLPWMMRDSTGQRTLIERAVDGAVVPSARRNGLFSRLIEAHTRELRSTPDQLSAIYSTPVPASRDAHTKLGWRVFEEPHYLSAVRPTTASIQRHVPREAPAPTSIPMEGRWETAWDETALRWRIDPRSGHSYRVYSTAAETGVCVAVMRRTTMKRIPVAVVVHQTGPPEGTGRLINAAALRMRCVAVLNAGSRSALHPGGRVVGATTISVWANQQEWLSRLGAAEAWTLRFADLEGVM